MATERGLSMATNDSTAFSTPPGRSPAPPPHPTLLEVAASSGLDPLLEAAHDLFLREHGGLEEELLSRLEPLCAGDPRRQAELEDVVNDLLVAVLDAGALIGFQLGQGGRRGQWAR